MKIGYPCINLSLKCSPNRKFRLSSFSEEKVVLTIKNNLDCLRKTLEYNKKESLYFFRISSETIPFASHPVMSIDWRKIFKEELLNVGLFIKKNNFRISMHPDQFILLNSIKKEIFERSLKELIYHDELLNAMDLDKSAKIQIHVGAVYDDKKASIERFIKRYKEIPEHLKLRLCIENDDKNFDIDDCFYIFEKTGIPIIFDYFHFKCKNRGEDLLYVFEKVSKTWKKEDGIMMVDYSSQEKGSKKGTHARSIDLKDFQEFIELTKPFDFDLMLEIKDKEKSALLALNYLKRVGLINSF